MSVKNPKHWLTFWSGTITSIFSSNILGLQIAFHLVFTLYQKCNLDNLICHWIESWVCHATKYIFKQILKQKKIIFSWFCLNIFLWNRDNIICYKLTNDKDTCQKEREKRKLDEINLAKKLPIYGDGFKALFESVWKR